MMSESEKESMIEEIKSELYLDRKDKGVMDALQEKVVSRKLLVFLTATALMWWSDLDPETWGTHASCHLA